ncbi:hypothetical protein I6U48_28510 [Clostridium sp. PL3]|uniref:DUF5666 domain-containing protein n=1 Tax=Clostridium thailandense TaxID=2794346 RepID=A0A949U1T8_9CLOT|nr:hypothetical protein [Clostridium thailandense]MBV7276818.1 hypothetical protein [Clostridium thailandense]
MNITKKMKKIGFTSLAALILVGTTSMVSYASTESDKLAKTSASVTTVKPDHISVSKSGDGIEVQTTTGAKIDNANLSKTESNKSSKISAVGTAVKPDQIFISKSADGIEVQTTTGDKIDNTNLRKTEPAKTDTDKAK